MVREKDEKTKCLLHDLYFSFLPFLLTFASYGRYCIMLPFECDEEPQLDPYVRSHTFLEPCWFNLYAYLCFFSSRTIISSDL